jgi:hypothetical protein
MLHKTSPIFIVVSLIALTVVTAGSFNHDYSALAVKSKKSSSTNTLGGGGSSSSSSAATASPNTLTKKELSSFTSCINTANKSPEGLTHKIVTNCLDTARGLTTIGAGAAAGAAAGGGGSGLGSSNGGSSSSGSSGSS